MNARPALVILICCCAGLSACTAAASKGPVTAVSTPAVGRPAGWRPASPARAPAGSALGELGINFQGPGVNPATLPQAEQAAIGKCGTITQDFTNAMLPGLLKTASAQPFGSPAPGKPTSAAG